MLKIKMENLFPSRFGVIPVVIVSFLLLPIPAWSGGVIGGGALSSQRAEGAGNNTMLDYAHTILTDSLVRPVVWFDSFFGEYRSLEEGYSSAYAIWQNDFRLEQSEGLIYRTRFRAHIRLPKASERLKLVLTRENEEDAQLDDEQRKSLALTGEDANDDFFLGLGYDMIDSFFNRLTLTAGLRFSIPIQEWLRLRYRYEYPIDPLLLLRFTETLYWESSDGIGEKTVFELERKLSDTTLFRWSVSGVYSEISSGYEFGSSLSFLHQLSPRRGIALDLGAAGATRPWVTMWNYIVDVRYRQSFYRKWLYYEIVPEVTWPKDEITGKREAVAAVTLRFEVQFRGDGK